MDIALDVVLQDLQSGRQRVRLLSRQLWREGRRAQGCDRTTLLAIAARLRKRQAPGPQSACLGICVERTDLLASFVRVGAIAQREGLDAESVELADMTMNVLLARAFNAAIAVTQCRDCASVMVWKQICAEALDARCRAAPVD